MGLVPAENADSKVVVVQARREWDVIVLGRPESSDCHRNIETAAEDFLIQLSVSSNSRGRSLRYD